MPTDYQVDGVDGVVRATNGTIDIENARGQASSSCNNLSILRSQPPSLSGWEDPIPPPRSEQVIERKTQHYSSWTSFAFGGVRASVGKCQRQWHHFEPGGDIAFLTTFPFEVLARRGGGGKQQPPPNEVDINIVVEEFLVQIEVSIHLELDAIAAAGGATAAVDSVAEVWFDIRVQPHLRVLGNIGSPVEVDLGSELRAQGSFRISDFQDSAGESSTDGWRIVDLPSGSGDGRFVLIRRIFDWIVEEETIAATPNAGPEPFFVDQALKFNVFEFKPFASSGAAARITTRIEDFRTFTIEEQ